jgi:D-alanine-D-alanine ligase
MTVHDNLAQGGVTHRVISDERLCVELASLARSAFEALELSGFGRIDFRVDASGRPYIFDVGVSPGLSTGSSAFASISALGLSHAEFLRSIVGASLSSQGLV